MQNDDDSDTEKSFFRSMMQGVTPLRETPTKHNYKPEKPKAKRRPQEAYAKPEQPTIQRPSLSNPYALPLHADCIMHYGRNTLAAKQFQALKQGLIPINQRLDLHGLNLEKASGALSNFILNNYQNQQRCLLIIHGKGGQDFNAPLLKNHVHHWLMQFPEVLAFHSARPKDGGTGAVYVLLKRNVPSNSR